MLALALALALALPAPVPVLDGRDSLPVLVPVSIAVEPGFFADADALDALDALSFA